MSTHNPKHGPGPVLRRFAEHVPCLGAVVACFVSLAATGCVPPPLTNGAPSAEALAQAVLEAVRTNDRARLALLAVGEREFREHVWPRLPAARPERNLPFAYVWGDLRQKSEAALAMTVARYRGRLFTVQGITFSGVTDYGGARVHRQAAFQVRDPADNESELRVCGSFLEQGGAWKVFSYVSD